MNSQLTWRLAIAATLVNSLHAGGNVNRALVEMRAWQQTGPLGWAAFSRHADLGPTAMVLYPLAALAGAILSIAAVLSFRHGRGVPRSAAVPLYSAALLAIGGLLATTQAAPIMLSVRHLGDDAPALQHALDGFQFWGNIRGVFQVLAFVANLWSVVALAHPTMARSAP
jgi:hypothetical protein